MKSIFTTLAVLLFLAPAPLSLAAPPESSGTRLLRYPDIHRGKVAFVYAGDIWIVNAAGGVARRLTSHLGQELFPKFSPDGQWIAFSGEYGGNRQVFLIRADGGTPRQLTYYNDVGSMPPRGGFDNRIIGWTPDGKKVIFKSNRVPWGVRLGRYFTIPVGGGLETPMPMPKAGGGDISPDGRRVAYTPKEREFRTWKRHKGGGAQDIWIYDLERDRAERITDFAGTDNQPVWFGDTIFFTSDRDGNLNLYAYDTVSRATRKVTDHDDYDVLFPSAGPDAVVYEAGGYIYRFDPATGKRVQMSIQVYGDFPETMPRIKKVAGFIGAADLSPSGARALFAARGDLFTAPAEKGEVRNLTRSSGIREMSPAWSPDGKWIAYLSDRTGEYEIYVRPQDGSGNERRVTTGGDIWRFPPVWSPDSGKLAFADRKQRLRYVDVKSGRVTEVDRGRYADITTYNWSPDSAWLAYTKPAATQMSVIWVYSLDDGKPIPLTSDLVNNFAPRFDPGGKYLYFLSDRDYNLTFSGFEFSYVYTNPTRLYIGTLNDAIPLPFAPESDEEETGDEGEGEDKKDDGKKDKGDKKDEEEAGEVPVVRIEPERFANRVTAIPGPSGHYRSLQATAKAIYYLSGEGPETALKRFVIEDEKEETILEEISGYVLSNDGEKILYQKNGHGNGAYGIVDAAPDQKNSDGQLKLDGMEMKIDPREEWRQIFVDSWRLLRDWFYDPAMHGLDWPAMRRRYEPLVAHLANRIDLDFILGELGGELSAGHVYVQPGDQPRVERQEGGLLGAELEAHSSGLYRFARIFPGENWHPDFRSPLTEPGVNVKVGDYLLAIDGREITTKDNPYRFLENRANRVVTLLVNDKPAKKGAREERVRPIARETNLRYLDWILERRRMVDEASGGRIGYIHLPDTAFDGNRELFKYFYPQAGKDALIVDVRYNGGGFIPDRMIELLDRPILNYWVMRGIEPGTTPGFAHQGPKVCLINGNSGSGGDAFPYYFRKRGLGKIIGTRTWGGLIGITGQPSLVDGGTVTAPQFRFLGTDGNWMVENEGVSPDIEVIDRPDLVARGQDPALEKGIEVLLEELKRNPPRPLKVPPPPIEAP